MYGFYQPTNPLAKSDYLFEAGDDPVQSGLPQRLYLI